MSQARVPGPLGSKQSGTAGPATTSVLFVASTVTSNGTAPKARGRGGERLSWPEPRLGAQAAAETAVAAAAAAAAAAATIHKPSRSTYPEQSHRDGP